ncbi:MAG: MOSC domain-containing protein [Arenicellales bacterium]|jgi:MOSC domain-containing protein YiiM|nr:MOSC domain-containing protein [Arenicellales bacterium]MDP6552484.1 MOSC domain-containing protein [Arenicellales bacterium]MDP6853880.1 MOSC domain-containing protein [Arenicellales bacterium]MDP6919617.1 MOSC domain-containing protein [Arenicellales bacterium]|tara:strand:+ start:419 stop:874 length:456 start_codon:yes stop_codon:yes gene_type:complete
MRSPAEVVLVCLSAAEGGAIREVPEAVATAGAGLEGDRYCTFGVSPETQLTLIESEAIDEFNQVFSTDLPVTAFRRNVITRGIRLNSLKGRIFTVGEVQLRGVKLCEPCAYLQKRLGIPGLVKQLTHKGGLRCEILAGGAIRPGDAVSPGG